MNYVSSLHLDACNTVGADDGVYIRVHTWCTYDTIRYDMQTCDQKSDGQPA